MKRTFQPNPEKKRKKQGFLARMLAQKAGGSHTIKRRRDKGRERLGVC